MTNTTGFAPKVLDNPADQQQPQEPWHYGTLYSPQDQPVTPGRTMAPSTPGRDHPVVGAVLVGLRAITSVREPLAGQAGPVSVAVIGLLTAAAIHVSVVGEHLHEWVPFGIALAAMGFAEAFLAVSLAQRPSRRCWITVCVVSFTTVALWALSRTAGLPIGLDPWHPEVIGRADTIATVAELVSIAAGLRALSTSRNVARHPRLIAAIGLAVAVPFTLMALSAATDQPAGALDTATCPNVGGLAAMHGGMVMQPSLKRPATPARQVATSALVAQTKAGLNASPAWRQPRLGDTSLPPTPTPPSCTGFTSP